MSTVGGVFSSKKISKTLHAELIKIYTNARSVTVNEMDTATQIQIQDDTVCILERANALDKGTNATTISPASS